jgi:hypothetical protein
MGPAFGISTSHRAECTGCLAGALFLYHIQLFTNLTLNNTATVITISDNKAMVDSLIKRNTYRTAYANTTLVCDSQGVTIILRFVSCAKMWRVIGNTADDMLLYIPRSSMYATAADSQSAQTAWVMGQHPDSVWTLHWICSLVVEFVPKGTFVIMSNYPNITKKLITTYTTTYTLLVLIPRPKTGLFGKKRIVRQ